jgi:putative ABC transport system permease protein
VIAARRAAAHPDEYPKHFSISIIGVIDWVVGRFRGILYVSFAAIGLLLVIACANVANMLLARATVRERELTMRSALGASSGRLVRQLLVENLLLALAGGAAGSLLALAGIRGLALVLPRQNVPYEVQLRVDAPALGFCLATAVITTLVFGLLPAWYAGGRDLVEGVKDGGRGSAAERPARLDPQRARRGRDRPLDGAAPRRGTPDAGVPDAAAGDLGFTPSNMVIAAVNVFSDGWTSCSPPGFGSSRRSTP